MLAAQVGDGLLTGCAVVASPVSLASKRGVMVRLEARSAARMGDARNERGACGVLSRLRREHMVSAREGRLGASGCTRTSLSAGSGRSEGASCVAGCGHAQRVTLLPWKITTL